MPPGTKKISFRPPVALPGGATFGSLRTFKAAGFTRIYGFTKPPGLPEGTQWSKTVKFILPRGVL